MPTQTPHFYKNIKGYFKEEFSGRYLSIILAELGKADGKAFLEIIKLSRNDQLIKAFKTATKERKIRYEVEHAFSSRNGNGKDRRADIAISLLGEQTPQVIFEIKEEDVNNKGNDDQIKDYIKCAKETGAFLFYLSRYNPPEKCSKCLDKNPRYARLISYRNLYEALRSIPAPSEIALLTQEYLEDINVATYQLLPIKKPKEKRNLNFFLSQLLPLPSNHGLGKLPSQNGVEQFPNFIKIMLGNVGVLAERYMKSNTIDGKNTPMVRMNVSPWIKRHKIKSQKDIEKLVTDGGYIQDSFIDGGTVYFNFYISTKLSQTQNHWVGIEIGFNFDLEKGKGTKAFLYVRGYGDKWKEDAWAEDDFDKFPSEEEAVRILNDLLSDVRKQCNKFSGNPKAQEFIKNIQFR